MPVVCIAGAGTDIGKTYVACALLRALRQTDRPVDALKPVASGFSEDDPEAGDPGQLLLALSRPITRDTLDGISPWRFAAPQSPPLAARMEGRRLVFGDILSLCRARAAAATTTTLIVETAGGVMSPLDDTHTMLDLMAALAAPVILVSGTYLGGISHTLTALSVLRAAGLEVPLIALSESDGAPPPFDETLAALAAFTGETRIVPFRRNVDPGGPAATLAACL